MIFRQEFANLAGCPDSNADGFWSKDGFGYVRTHLVDRHIDDIRKSGCRTLISHGSDAPADDRLAGLLPDNVKTWFATNATASDPRVRGLPIGMKCQSRNLDVVGAITTSFIFARSFENLMYVCHTTKHPPLWPEPAAKRSRARDLFVFEKWATVEGGQGQFDVPFDRYLWRMRSHPFVLSPAGNGVDCHRTWEALTLGCVPVVENHPAMRWFADLPILFVASFLDVSESMLRSRTDLIERANDNASRYWTTEYWTDKIHERHQL